jgi:predicted AAA+ superfamily ATPase
MVQRDLYMRQIIPLIDNELIKVITGIRRCGKSYMLGLIKEELLKRGIKEQNIILINFDSKKYKNIKNGAELDKIVEKSIKNKKGRVYLFFDEIQNVKKWERSIAGYKVDYDCDIYITGSNSKLLSGELATHLTGRYYEIKMYPFSYQEFLKFHQKSSSIDMFNEYLQYGGMPQTFLLDETQKIDYLDDLFNSIFYKDIVKRYQIRDIDILERLTTFIFDNIGNIFSASSIAEYYKKEMNIKISNKTITNYLKYLENACFIKKVKREDLEGKGILKFNEKYYVTDHGFCEAKAKGNIDNIGRVMENIVYFEFLRRGWKITIGKTNNYEVDFVCRKHKQTVYVQVSYLLENEETIEREFRPFSKIKDHYPKYIITMDQFDRSRDGIKHVNLLEFLTDEKKIKS